MLSMAPDDNGTDRSEDATNEPGIELAVKHCQEWGEKGRQGPAPLCGPSRVR